MTTNAKCCSRTRVDLAPNGSEDRQPLPLGRRETKAVRVAQTTLSSLMVGIAVAACFMTAVTVAGWAGSSFLMMMIVIPASGISRWQDLGIRGALVVSLTSWLGFLSLLLVSSGPELVLFVPLITILLTMGLWCVTQCVQPHAALHTLTRQIMWGTTSFLTSQSLICTCCIIYISMLGVF
jgi:hypothetical protein